MVNKLAVLQDGFLLANGSEVLFSDGDTRFTYFEVIVCDRTDVFTVDDVGTVALNKRRSQGCQGLIQ